MSEINVRVAAKDYTEDADHGGLTLARASLHLIADQGFPGDGTWTSEEKVVFRVPAGSSPPTLVQNAVNGRPAVRFSGTAALTGPVTLGAQLGTVVMVIEQKALHRNKVPWALSKTYVHAPYSDSSSGTTFSDNSFASWRPDVRAACGVAYGEWCVLTWVEDGKTCKLYKNSELKVTFTGGAAPQWGSESLTLGNHINIGASTSIEGHIAELLVYPSALSEESRAQVERDLKRKYFSAPVKTVGDQDPKPAAPEKQSISGTDGASLKLGPAGSSGDCDKVREELAKQIAALGKKLDERDQGCGLYEQRLDALEKRGAAQARSLVEQETRRAELEKKILEQERSNVNQERRLLAQDRELLKQDKKLTEQERSNVDQERKLLEQDRKLAAHDTKLDELEVKVAKCGACDDKIGALAGTIGDLSTKLVELDAKAARCGECDEKIGAQTRTIDDLSWKLDELARKLAEATVKPVTPEPKVDSKVVEPQPPPRKADNLETIEGIGPKIAELLKAAGIMTYKDLAAADLAELKKILKAGGAQYARSDASSWPKQAQLTVDGKKAELKALQDTLRGGRPGA